MNLKAAARQSVSSPSELLITVDRNGNELGTTSKADAHRSPGILHRAFSIFLFDRDGHVLLQQRATNKPLWPEYWTNTCCSHPRHGEDFATATERRLLEEMGVYTPLHYLYTFEYQADYIDIGSEHEHCAVYAGVIDQHTPINPHPEEVMAWQWLEIDAVDYRVAQQPETLTPWFLLEWKTIRARHWNTLEALLS